MAPPPVKPRLRSSWWFSADGKLQLELVLMTERRELVHRETLDASTDEKLLAVHAFLLGRAGSLALKAGAIEPPPELAAHVESAAEPGEQPPGAAIVGEARSAEAIAREQEERRERHAQREARRAPRAFEPTPESDDDKAPETKP